MPTASAPCEMLADRVRELIRQRGLDVHAWFLSDTVETLVWYACRDVSLAERLRITRDARLAAAAGPVRDPLDKADYDGLIDALPGNLHGIFMRAEGAGPQRSW